MSASPALQTWRNAFDAQPRDDGQRKAFEAFLAKGLPTTKLDAWKYTDLRRLALKQFSLAMGGAPDQLPPLLPFANRIVFVDGALLPTPAIGTSNQALGYSVTTSVSPLPAPLHEGPLGLLNAALATAYVAIEIPANVKLESPLYIAYVWTSSAKNAMVHPRLSLSLGRNSQATVIEHYVGADSEINFTNSVLSIELAEAGRLEHIRIQDDAASFNIGHVRAVVAQNACYQSHHYVFGGGLARTDIDVQLTGPEARTELHGLIFARESQHLDVRTCIEHVAPHTQSREDYRGIADQRGRVVFNGKVIVAKDAQQTDAAQSSRNLLLSPYAEIDTRPELEIYANDVKCAHGATVGQLDATALFYLQARGIARDEARALLIHAFAAQVIERIPVNAVRDHVLARFMERMRTGVVA